MIPASIVHTLLSSGVAALPEVEIVFDNTMHNGGSNHPIPSGLEVGDLIFIQGMTRDTAVNTPVGFTHRGAYFYTKYADEDDVSSLLIDFGGSTSIDIRRFAGYIKNGVYVSINTILTTGSGATPPLLSNSHSVEIGDTILFIDLFSRDLNFPNVLTSPYISSSELSDIELLGQNCTSAGDGGGLSIVKAKATATTINPVTYYPTSGGGGIHSVFMVNIRAGTPP